MPKEPGKGKRPDGRNANRIALARFINDRRKALGLKMVDIARMLGDRGFRYSTGAISHWVNDDNPARVPLDDPDFVIALADVLETTPARIFEVAGILPGGRMTLSTELAYIVRMFEQLDLESKELLKNLLERLIRKR